MLGIPGNYQRLRHHSDKTKKNGIDRFLVPRRSEWQNETEAPRKKTKMILTLLSKENMRGNSWQELIEEDTLPAESMDTANKLTLANHKEGSNPSLHDYRD